MFPMLQRSYFILLAIFLLAGCEDLGKVNWSPDGKRCSVLGEHNLQIGDSTGALHAEPSLRAAIFEWMPDSKTAIIVTGQKASWSQLTKIVSTVDLKKITIDANHIFLNRNQPNQINFDKLKPDYDWSVYNLYLKNRYGKSYLSSALYKALEEKSINAPAISYTAQIYDFSVCPPVPKAVLFQTAKQIKSITVSPNSRLVAIAEKENICCKLNVVSVNGTERRVISRLISPSICWSNDSTAVFFVSEDNASSDETLKPGTLKNVIVAGQNGPLLPKPSRAESLACIEFDADNTLYCLPDGSILFKSQELKFPNLKNEGGLNRSIFALRADGKAIDKLKLSTAESQCNVQTYAVNHSGTKLVASGYKGQIWLLDLQTHANTTVQGDVGETKLAPSWRTDNQFTYAIRNHAQSMNGHDIEIALRNADDGTEQIISEDWSTADMTFLRDAEKDSTQRNGKSK